MENNQSLFLAVLVIGGMALILMVVFFASGTIVDQSGANEIDTFSVTDVTTDEVCTLDKTPYVIRTVMYNDGTGWVTLGAGDYTQNGRTVTVSAASMT